MLPSDRRRLISIVQYDFKTMHVTDSSLYSRHLYSGGVKNQKIGKRALLTEQEE